MFQNCIHYSIMTVLLLLPLVLTSYDNILKFNDFSSSTKSLHEVVFQIVSSCFSDTNKLITLSGNVSQKVVEKFHKSELVSLTRLSNDLPSFDEAFTIAKQTRPMYTDGFYFRFEYKAEGFILTASSQPILRDQLEKLKNSRWWKSQGYFLIINEDMDIDNNCKNAPRFLWLAWRYNILSSIFLCRDMNKEITMYTYNPYNNMVPKNWIKVRQYSTQQGHPWNLYKRNVSHIPDDCGEIFFDKTKTLDDYKIRSNAVSLGTLLLIDYNKKGLERYGGKEGIMIKCILHFLNASLEDIPYTGTDRIGYFDENGTYVGMLGDVFTGRVDIGLNARYMVNMWKLGMTYPHASTNLCFVVKSRGNIPQWMNLGFVFDVWTSLGFGMIISLTIAVLSYYSNFSSGCLNCLRLLVTTSLRRLPSQFSVRLFLANIFILFLLVNGIFQGRLVSLLTKPRAYRNPETQVELRNAGYKVIGYPPFRDSIDDPILRSRFEPSQLLDYMTKLKSTKYVSCIIDCRVTLLNISSKDLNELHFVAEELQTFHTIFVTSLDWPLLHRFDQILQRLFESGLPDHWTFQDFPNTRHWKSGAFEKNNSHFLSLQDVAFIFHWLLLGLFIATLVLFYEVISFWYKIRCEKSNPSRLNS